MKGPLTVMSGSASNKPRSERPLLVELKNGKAYFKQKCISFEKQSETLQEIVQFREMLEDRIERQASPLTAIPEEHRPLIAKMAHERKSYFSDKTLAALSKHIRHELLPTQDEDEVQDGDSSPASLALPLSAVEAAIKLIMQRNNYGLDGIGGGKPPAAVCVWRWEVKEQHRDWLPKHGREKAENRLAERIQVRARIGAARRDSDELQAKKDLWDLFEALPQNDRDAILDPKGAHKGPPKEPPSVDSSKPIDLTTEDNGSPQSSKKQQKKKSENEENSDTSKKASKVVRATKALDPQKAIKEQEKLEKKAAKAEKEKKEKEAQIKSRSLMANFFAKSKKTPSQSPSKETSTPVAGPSNVQTDFERHFKPFVLKKDSELAQINWFSDSTRRTGSSSMKLDNGVIVLDEDDEPKENGDVEMKSVEPDVTRMSTHDHLRSIISTLPSPAGRSRRHVPYKGTPHLKTHSSFSVRDTVSRLSEAEIVGDISLVRSLLSQLSDRSLLPAKVFIFSEDARPGYFGTWTRNSRIIGPRSPFAKDVLVFDYGYDSGEEWEDEPAGDADDVVEDAEDEDDAEDVDSDLDSWLVDDDEEPEMPLDEPEFHLPDLPPLPTKRKAEEGEKKMGKKRKVVIPLVPFARGPCWETSIGHCETDLFEPYQIRMFNDSPFPIDPFTFVSTCLEDSQDHPKPAISNDGVFAVPSLPDRLANVNSSTVAGSAISSSSSPPAPKKPAPAPKTPFPDAFLPVLLEKIASLKTGSINFLVEAIHRDLRDHKVKKNTIEAKVKEVGEKCKEKKFWVVKPVFQIPT
ncbi:hypothetical protein Hypma_008755 [Hypsizygus marmoreus]|uniref:Chromatin assembly factor 1 subunit A dimerization domain-containing protein n=1 Tax=Hypsizygus marmoreus TaxID=39966 RepID=A0A369JPV1_HYPMA|nr:hypothetical protein Hypma_008755 [Hypsizygus marmoreus]